MKKLILIIILGLSQVACVSGSSGIVGADGMADNKLVRVPNIETPVSAARTANAVARSAT